MLRIQKAVLKAKDAQQHQSLRKRTESSHSNSPLEDLQYSKTRVVKSHPTSLEENRVIASFLDNKNSQIFRTLRTQVIQKMRENNWRSLAITSPSEGEGKSLIAANLAVAIAMEVNQTVLLVDLDLKDPKVGDLFTIQQEYGFSDYIQGKVELEDIMVNPGIERLVVIPGRGSMGNSSEIISSPKMVSFFNETRTRYKSRIVIYDMPPILPSDDVLGAIGHVDCSLLVLEDGKNSEQDIVRAARQLPKESFIGTVVNKFNKGSWLL